MRGKIKKIAVTVIVIVSIVAVRNWYLNTPTFSSENPIECKQSGDCILIKVGCYHWEAVNKAHRKDALRRDSYGACSASVPAGPKPDLACLDGVCVLLGENGSVIEMDRGIRYEIF